MDVLPGGTTGDIADVQGGTTGEGIHLGAMAGTLDFVQRGLTGPEARRQALWLDPVPLPELSSYEFTIRYQGHRDVRMRLECGRLSITVPPPAMPPSTSGCRTARCVSRPGKHVRCRCCTRPCPLA